jgi:hypothetical protein
MKKPKISLDSAKLKDLFVRHVEKLLLILVVGAMLYLVYQGFSMPGLEQGKTPQGLLETSQAMLQFINDPNRWNQIQEERQITANVVNDVKEDRFPIDGNQYFLPIVWDKPNFPKLSPRTDPKIFAPIHLVVRPIVGPLAYLKSETYVDPLQPAVVEGEEPAPKRKAKPKPKQPKGGKAGGRMPPGMVGGSADAPYGPPGSGKKGRRGGEDLLGMGSEPPGFDAGGEMGAMDMEQTTQPLINPEAILGYEANIDAERVNTHAVVVMAVVPYEKQLEEFQNALLNSLDHDSQRDSPRYLQYYVQRADVTDNPDAELTEADWAKEPISVNAAKQETFNWAGEINEVVDQAYIDTALTHPAPPFMQRDLWDLLTHPEVPLPALAATDATPVDRGPRVRPKAGATGTDDAPTIDGLAPQRGGSGVDGMDFGMPGAAVMPGSRPPGGMPGGRPPGGGVSRPPGASMPPGAGGPGGSRPPGAGGPGGMPPGAGGPRGMSGPPGYGPPGYGPAGMGGDVMSGYGAGLGAAPPPKYKLIRFTDTTVEPDRKYRYRLKVLLNDPNHPHPSYVAPSLASLDQKVRDRIRGLDSSNFWVASEWSEPSPLAELPARDQYFAGSVTQPAAHSLVAGKPPVPVTTHPTGKSLVVVWDGTKVVDVAAEVEVHRGSIFNFVKDVQVIHPVDHSVVEVAEYLFSTNAFVADIAGGEEIPVLDKRNEKPNLIAPGEMLIIDGRGRLHVTDETDDIEGYRRYLVAEPAEMETTSAADSSAEFGDILGMPMPGNAPPGMGRPGSAPPGMGGPGGRGPPGMGGGPGSRNRRQP